MAVTTTINPGPRSTELDGLTEAIESHPIWTELRGPDNGNITSQVASGSANSNYTNTYGYNPAANITQYNHTRSGSDPTSTSTTTYTWDHNANRLSAGTTSGANTTNQNWAYRTDNSISTQTVTVSGSSAVTKNYSYNQAGLLTSITPNGSQTACVTNTYDDLDRIKTASTNAVASCGTTTTSTVSYTYDGLDRQRTATLTGSSTPTATIYDGLSRTTTGQAKAAAGDNSKPTNLYQLTPDGRHIAVWQASTSSTASLIDDDSTGNTSLLINASKTGTSATGCTVNYDPFGSPTAPTTAMTNGNGVCSSGTDATTTGNATWYQDQRRDGTTGNYQLGTRTYNPGNASYGAPDNYRVASPGTDLAVGTDPVTANTYTYVNGNPLNYNDPDGHEPRLEGRCFADDHACNYNPDHPVNRAPGQNGQSWGVGAADPRKPRPPSRAQIIKEIKRERLATVARDLDFGSYYSAATDSGAHGLNYIKEGGKGICYGQKACDAASEYISEHPGDSMGAAKIAVGYCLDHPKSCDSFDLGTSIAHASLVLTAALAAGAAGAGAEPAEGEAADEGAGGPSSAYHYTGAQNVASIESKGLRAGAYATPDGSLSPLQAQVDLALPPNRGLPGATLRVDLDGLRNAGYEIPSTNQVGRSYNMPGGGTEMQFSYSIPPQFIKVVP